LQSKLNIHSLETFVLKLQIPDLRKVFSVDLSVSRSPPIERGLTDGVSFADLRYLSTHFYLS